MYPTHPIQQVFWHRHAFNSLSIRLGRCKYSEFLFISQVFCAFFSKSPSTFIKFYLNSVDKHKM